MGFKYAIALTGSIATGKSSAARILTTLGFTIIDADTVAHQILNEQHLAIATLFGDALVVNGEVDRKSLGSVVFTDEVKRKQLEALLHPLIYEEIEKRASELDTLKTPYLVDIPLFFEGKRYPIKKSLVVCTTEVLQLQRLMQRNDYSKEEALARMATQISIDKKCKMGDYVIDNSGTLAQLEHECQRVKDEIVKDFR